MTDNDFVKAGLLAAAEAPDADFDLAVRRAVSALDDSSAVGDDMRPTAPDRSTADRLHRAEAEAIDAWGVLHTTPGFRAIPGERLPDALRRALSAANLKE